jgi:two-component system chemotaxis response regulator CheB
MSQRIRVLIADDSSTVRAALSAMLRDDPRIEVVGEAEDGVTAVEKAKLLRPDVITMDVKMPRLDGLEATAAIMASSPARILVVCAVSEQQQQDLSFRAIASGALELVAKPSANGTAEMRTWGKRVAEAVRLMAEVPVVTRRRAVGSVISELPAKPRPMGQPATIPPVRPQTGSLDAFAIVASTGGPPALAQVLGSLPAELPVPIFIAQHMAQGFVSGLVRWLASVTSLRVETARTGEAARPGTVYLPPDGHDLLVDEEGLLLTELSRGGHCPSGDRLLFSLAKAYRERAGAVVLTGMGDDGAAGLLALRNAGGSTFAQDEATSVIYGMPRVAFNNGGAQSQLPIYGVAGVIRSLSERRR